MTDLLPQEFIRQKRDDQPLSPRDIAIFVQGLADGTISEGQAAAFAMAVFFRGMTRDEAVALTRAMRDSGTVIDWSKENLDGPLVDKHSTGGVGDNVSLMLAPMLAACGAYVPMISGRGLGHTGGTLDKLDSIPGYRSQPDLSQFAQTIRTAGCAIIGQTDDLAPADRRLYAIRDITATVESIPLITASILSKKLAAGLDALVLDVKTGSGAFMSDVNDARTLASSLVEVANGAGLATTALITDMNAPLAPVAGNAVEVAYAASYLAGDTKDERLHRINLALGAELLMSTGLAETTSAAHGRLDDSLASGRAAAKFDAMVAALGGPPGFIENHHADLPQAPIQVPVFAAESGAVESVDTRAIGIAVIELGGGRRRADDQIDHAVGLTHLVGPGEVVDRERPLATIHARNVDDVARVDEIVQRAFTIGTAGEQGPEVLERITGNDP